MGLGHYWPASIWTHVENLDARPDPAGSPRMAAVWRANRTLSGAKTLFRPGCRSVVLVHKAAESVSSLNLYEVEPPPRTCGLA